MCQHSAPTPISIQPAAACACSTQTATGSGPHPGKRVPAGHDLDFPEVPFPGTQLLASVGEEMLRKVVFHHHRLLRDSSIGHMFASADEVFDKAIGIVADFVVEACGGAKRYTEIRGSGCMRTRHFPFTIDESGREVWLENLHRALRETGFPVAWREEYWNWLEPMSVRMINRRTSKAQPLRLAWAEAEARYAAVAL